MRLFRQRFLQGFDLAIGRRFACRAPGFPPCLPCVLRKQHRVRSLRFGVRSFAVSDVRLPDPWVKHCPSHQEGEGFLCVHLVEIVDKRVQVVFDGHPTVEASHLIGPRTACSCGPGV